MPANFTREQLLAAFDRWHVRYVEHGRWWERNTGYPWDFEFGLLHHDALNDQVSTQRGVDLMIKGRPDLKGPLSNGWQEDDGWLHLIALGNTNNCGRIADQAWRNILANKPPTTTAGAAGWPDSTRVGNTYTWAVEIHNAGDGRDPYEAGQMQNLVLMAAAICELTGMDPNRWYGHADVTKRKPDPRGLDRLKFIEAVKVCLFVGPDVAIPTPTQEEMNMLGFVLDLWELCLGIDRATVMSRKDYRQIVMDQTWRLTDGIPGPDGIRMTPAKYRQDMDRLARQGGRI